MDQQSFSVITNRLMCHRLYEKLVTSRYEYHRLKEQFCRHQELRHNRNYTSTGHDCRCHCQEPCGVVRIPECHVNSCVKNCSHCRSFGEESSTSSTSSRTCCASVCESVSDIWSQTLCSLSSSCSSLHVDDFTFRSDYGLSRKESPFTSSSSHPITKRKRGGLCDCDAWENPYNGKSRMESCLKRRDQMQQQQQHNDDEENNINSSNTNTSCGDRLVSPYKRMKVSDKSRASEKSVSFAPDTSKPSHYATPKLVANCGSSANSLNSGHHANGSRANVANCGSSTDLARSGSHGSAGSLGNAVEPLRPEDSYPSDLALTVKNPTKRKVLQTQGQLKVAAYMNSGLLTIHVIQGRQFSSGWKPLCDSFVKMSVIPEDRSRKMRLRTKVIADSNNPVYDEKFSLELSPNDDNKRVLISVWHKDQNSGLSEFLGCMSFGVKSIAQSTKEVNGWYYLLTEDVGKRKHLVASAKPRSSLKMRGHNNIPVINKDVIGLKPVTVSMARGKNGFGFSVVEEFPVKVGRVDLASPAESAGLKQGDYIIKVNNQNVSRSTVVSVAKLVKKSGPSLLLHVQRPRQPAQEEEPATNTAYRRSEPIYESIVEEPAHAESVADRFTHYQEHEISVDHDVTAPYAPFPVGQMPTSTPLPLMHMGHRTVPTFNVEQKKQEAIHRLLSLELDFIDFMHAGIQRYSRPLRHCILSVAQHKTVFQNVEKLVTISEYHVKQMQENSPSMCSESEDDSQSSDDKLFTSSVALIYHSKVHMFCQAHETYALGLSEANRVLSELRQNEDFVRFVKEPALEAGQPSISAFIFRPLQHIKELYLVLQDIYMFTPPTSPDHSTLRQVTQVLNESICSISNMSNARVQSLTSLTSHTKTSSTHGSSSGKGSSASSSASSATSTSSRDSCCSSHRSNKGMPTLPQSASMQSIHTVDREVMKLQDRLVFSENVPVFQLCQEDRHIIYQGEVFHWYGRQWAKTTLVLLSDLLLVLQADMDGSLHVLTNPLLLHDICGLEMDRKHGTEFVLHMCPTSPCTGIPASQKLVFRTPAIEDKFMWKRLLSQQVSGIRSEHTFENIYSSEVSSTVVI